MNAERHVDRHVERHRAPALWIVTAAILAAGTVAVQVSTRAGIALVVGTLALAAGARVAYRGRRPEGVAVRATWVDVVVLATLACSIALLATTPGV